MEDVSHYFSPSKWFSETASYSGSGRIEFSDPQGWVEGRTTFEVDRFGDITVNIKIDRWANYADTGDAQSVQSRDWLLSGYKLEQVNSQWKMYVIPTPAENTITLFELGMPNGDILTSTNVSYYSWEPNPGTVSLSVDKAIYVSAKRVKSEAKYWIIPCINLISEPFGATEAHRYTNLRNHLLRIYPVSQEIDEFLSSEASEEDRARVMHNLIAYNYLICFAYNNKPAFIERLPHYEQNRIQLKEGSLRSALTAIMIGEIDSSKHELHPMDLLGVLELALGYPIGASWIEYRDENGDLVYRFHANFGRPNFRLGRSSVNDVIHNAGLTHLLTQAAKSEAISDPLIRGALSHAAYALSSTDSTEMLYYAFTAIDAVFAFHNIEQQIHPIKKHLSNAQINAIEIILKKAANDISALKATLVNINSANAKREAETLDKVANKTRSQPLDKRSDFGDKLKALLEFMGFHDLIALEQYYSDIEEWLVKVSSYRNITMHSTHYGDIFDPQEHQNFQQIVPHLRDILVRVLLKTLGYDGYYSPLMDSPNASEKVDWIQQTTSPDQLGHK